MYRRTLDETTICSWTVVEPAVAVLSGCLPTMAPLLKVRMHPRVYFSSIFHLSFHSRGRTSGSDEKGVDQGQYSRELNQPKLGPHHDATLISKASARPRGEQSEDSDLVPLQSIMVREDMEWGETHSKNRYSQG